MNQFIIVEGDQFEFADAVLKTDDIVPYGRVYGTGFIYLTEYPQMRDNIEPGVVIMERPEFVTLKGGFNDNGNPLITYNIKRDGVIPPEAEVTAVAIEYATTPNFTDSQFVTQAVEETSEGVVTLTDPGIFFCRAFWCNDDEERLSPYSAIIYAMSAQIGDLT